MLEVTTSPMLAQARKYNMRRDHVEIPRMVMGPPKVMYHDDGKKVTATSLTPTFESIHLQAREFAASHEVIGQLTVQKDVSEQILRERLVDGLEQYAVGIARDSAQQHAVSYSFESATRLFEMALRALPTKYRRNLRDLRFFVSPEVGLAYQRALSRRMGAGNGPRQYQNQWATTYAGVPLVVVESMEGMNLILTHPDNLVLGVMGEPTIDSQPVVERDAERKVISVRADFVVQNKEAIVVGEQVAVSWLREKWIKLGRWYTNKKTELIKRFKS